MNHETGDFEAELFDLLPRLRRFCYALCGAAHDADDLLQSTVERLLIKPPPADADTAKWTFRVCKNLWFDELRSRKVRSADPIEPDMELAGPEGEKSMMERLVLKETNDAMANLPEDQRAVIALVALEGFTYQETAEALGIPIGTVMSRLSRARATLADALCQNEQIH